MNKSSKRSIQKYKNTRRVQQKKTKTQIQEKKSIKKTKAKTRNHKSKIWSWLAVELECSPYPITPATVRYVSVFGFDFEFGSLFTNLTHTLALGLASSCASYFAARVVVALRTWRVEFEPKTED